MRLYVVLNISQKRAKRDGNVVWSVGERRARVSRDWMVTKKRRKLKRVREEDSKA